MATASWVYILAWVAVSCTMILFNKIVLVNFPFPIFLTAWHMCFATIVTQVMRRVSPDMLPSVQENKVNFTIIWKKMLPVAFAFSVSLIFSNKTYLYLPVSYIQMLKAFTPVAVLILSFLNGLEKSSLTELVLVLIISAGIALTTIGEAYFSLIGFIFQLTAVMFESTRLVLTNLFLRDLQLDALSALHYVAPLCLGFLLIAFVAFEASTLPLDEVLTLKFILILLANGIVAFSLNIALVCVIKYTSAVTLTLAGILKDILLVVLSMVLLKSPVTGLQYFGYFIALMGLNAHKEYKKDGAVFEKLWAQIQERLNSTDVAESSSQGKAMELSKINNLTSDLSVRDDDDLRTSNNNTASAEEKVSLLGSSSEIDPEKASEN